MRPLSLCAHVNVYIIGVYTVVRQRMCAYIAQFVQRSETQMLYNCEAQRSGAATATAARSKWSRVAAEYLGCFAKK